MKVASAISVFKEKWESVVGTGSELDRSLSPELRKFRCVLSGMPVVAVTEILEGISVADTEMQMLKPVFGGSCVKARDMAMLSMFVALVVVVTCGLCSLCGVSWGRATLAASLLASVTVFVAGRRISKKIPDKKELCASTGICEVSVSVESVSKAVDKSYESLSEAVSCMKRVQDDASKGYDITDSRQFGEWVQKFVDYCNDSPEDSNLRVLKGELLSKLRMMGIEVYDAIRKDGYGNVILPGTDGFRDERTTAEAGYSEVRHAVVSSRRRVLAIGELA